MLGMPTWPPPDTDRNRFLFRLGFPIGVLASAYVLVFALVSNGWLPFVVAVLLIAGTLVLGIGLLLMLAQRTEAEAEAESEAVSGPEPEPGFEVTSAEPDEVVRPRPRPRPAPNAR